MPSLVPPRPDHEPFPRTAGVSLLPSLSAKAQGDSSVSTDYPPPAQTARPLVNGAVYLAVGQLFNQACLLLKNVILARLISTVDYGIASALGLALSVIEMTSNIAIGTLIIQSPQGNDPDFNGTAQLLQLYRGLVNTLLLFFLAGPISFLFGIPDTRWAFRCLALVPLLRGCSHLDLYRLQRELRFSRVVLTDSTANLAGTCAALICGLHFRNYAAMLAVILIQTLTFAVASHLFAARRFHIAWVPAYVARIFSFGWPLLINGLLMYAIFEGDRLAIGTANKLFKHTFYTMADLGIYSAAFSITMAPALAIVNVFSSLFMPRLSSLQTSLHKFTSQYKHYMRLLSLIAASYSIFFILLGRSIIGVSYGSKYFLATPLLAWLSVMWALRIIRSGPTVASLAVGDPKNSMISNVGRNLSLIGVIAAVAVGCNLVWVAISGLAGELAALMICTLRLNRKHSIPYRLCLGPTLAAGAPVVAAGLLTASGLPALGLFPALLASCLLVAILMGGMIIYIPEYRLELYKRARRLQYFHQETGSRSLQ